MRNFFLLLFLSSTLICQAQSRPTVGLALSGGGAKGFAHIGVLEIIDSLSIPIDFVAGTSMGAIVGGLYSIGYTADMIADEVNSTDWTDLMNDTPQRKYENYSTKDNKKRNLFTIGIKDWQIVLPSGLNGASKVNQKLHNATLGYHGNTNFLSYPRGFVCIGADLNHGKEMVITSGSLPDAMRASMSIPTMFTPHKFQGKTVVDGGAINNFPTDKLKDLGCDIIIGIDLQTTISDTTTITLTKVLEKTAMFINTRSNEAHQKLCSVLIKPQLAPYGSKSFSNSKEIIALGKQSARAHLSELKHLADQLRPFPIDEIETYRFSDTVQIDSTEIYGLRWVSASYINGVLGLSNTEPTSIAHLEEAVNYLYGSGYFEQVAYNLEKNADNTYRLVIDVAEKNADVEIGFGLHYDPDFETSFLLNFSQNNILFKGSRLSIDAIVSPKPRFKFLYEVDRGTKIGFGLRSDLYFSSNTMYSNYVNQGKYSYNDYTVAAYGLFSLNNIAIIKFGAEINSSNINLKDVPAIKELLDSNNLNPDATILNFNNYNIFMRLGVDYLDDLDYPTKGQQFKGVARYHTSDFAYISDIVESQFISVYTTYKAAISPNAWFTILPELTGGISFLNEPSFNYSYTLGGLGKNYFNYQTPFLGYHYNEVIGMNNLAKAGLELRFNPFGRHYISGMANYALTIDKTTLNGSESSSFTGFGFKYGIDTFLGPVELTAHKNLENGPWLLYFNLGHWF